MKSLKDCFEGKPVHSPLHPALVHLPIAFLPLSLVLDLASWVWQNPAAHLPQAATLSLAIGIATGLVAGLVGFVDYTEIRADHPAKKTATAHMILNLLALGVFAVSFGLRWGSQEALETGGSAVLLSAIGVIGLSISGYLGGHLVYNDGIAVGRHRHAPSFPDSTVTRTGAAGEFTDIANDTALAIGETLRVNANGVIVAIARTPNGVFAFQEYCTHRFGPLSEGQLKGCEVVCPWHRSAFDVRTGKVTSGPATVDLRTFAVRVLDGKIWLQLPPQQS